MDDQDQIEAAVEALASPDWPARFDALAAIRGALGDGTTEATRKGLTPKLLALVEDQSWKVRQVLASVLGLLGPAAEVHRALDRLVEDTNRYVREAAIRARVRKRADSGDWRVTAEKEDPVFQTIWTEIRRAGPPAVSEAALYQAAQRIADAAYRAVAADATHELNTVLYAIDGFAEELGQRLAQLREEDAQVGALFRRLQERSGLARRIVQSLRYYSAPSDGPIEDVEAGVLLREAAQLAQDSVSRRLPPPQLHHGEMTKSRVPVVKDRILCAITNVISNALEACRSDGAVTVHATASPQSVIFCVEDNGCGMDDNQLAVATRRFTTNKQEIGGTGMGLAIAQRVIEDEHNGRLEISSVVGAGTTVTIILPVPEGSKGGSAA